MNERTLVKYSRSNLWSRWLHAVARAGDTGQKIILVMKSTLSHDCLLEKSAQSIQRLGRISPKGICRRFIADPNLDTSQQTWTSLGITSPQKKRQKATAKLFRKSEEINGNLLYCICPPWSRISPSGLHSQSTTRSCPEPDFAPIQPSQSKEGGAYVEREKWMQGNLNNRSNFGYNQTG